MAVCAGWRRLEDRGFATFLTELLSTEETRRGYHNFDFMLMADRLAEVTERLSARTPFVGLPIGYFATSTEAAAMTIAGTRPDCPADALVMCDARPELASAELSRVRAPTLLIVQDEEPALELNRRAVAKLRCPRDLVVLPGMQSLASPKRASAAGQLAADWFTSHLLSGEHRG